jgi:hypothetical protein
MLDIEKLIPKFQSRLAERTQCPWRQPLGFDLTFAATVGDRPASSPDTDPAVPPPGPDDPHRAYA